MVGGMKIYCNGKGCRGHIIDSSFIKDDMFNTSYLDCNGVATSFRFSMKDFCNFFLDSKVTWISINDEVD